MQKFIFNKNSLPISIRSRLTPTDLQQLPELFLLEGELLEGGGTVEELQTDHWLGDVIGHNKKEEEVKLPEMIYLRTNSSLADIKINEILTYLASKEKK